jgi:lysophospholipid acyltransferase (LPLAT)-like uncharacterized protein
MGVYHIKVRDEKVEKISLLMHSIGFPVIRQEKQENGVCYFCANPKRLNKTWSFSITHENPNGPRFFSCGLSQLSKQIVRSLHREGFFIRD